MSKNKKETHRVYIKDKYHKDINYRERHKATVDRRKKEIRDWFYSIKRKLKCEKCEETHVACLDFHHREPKEKEFVLCNCWNKGFSKEKILNEIAKCRVLCSHCHRKEHWNEEFQCWDL